MKTTFKNFMIIIIMLFVVLTVRVGANPISAKPFQIIPNMEYPSDVSFGFIGGCQKGFVELGAFSDKLWPDQIYVLCGCMMDFTRVEIPYKVFLDRFRKPELMTEQDRKWIGEKLNFCVTSITRSWAQNEQRQGNKN